MRCCSKKGKKNDGYENLLLSFAKLKHKTMSMLLRRAKQATMSMNTTIPRICLTASYDLGQYHAKGQFSVMIRCLLTSDEEEDEEAGVVGYGDGVINASGDIGQGTRRKGTVLQESSAVKTSARLHHCKFKQVPEAQIIPNTFFRARSLGSTANIQVIPTLFIIPLSSNGLDSLFHAKLFLGTCDLSLLFIITLWVLTSFLQSWTAIQIRY
ncbi:hypothetical protein FB446DRAFT_709928 [Lentinula raphanica]|nr:hypothetical protein FB446DRAFT_709928 [Lentinula raphanica]